jgi:hypothetical protein
MLRITQLPTLVLAVAGLIAPVPVVAQSPVGGLYTLVLPSGAFGSNQFTEVITSALTSAAKFCGALDKSYRVDCLSERIGAMANEIPADSDYAEIKGVLQNTANRMENLARSNRDRAQPRQSVSSGGSKPIATTRPLTPVKPAVVDSVNQQAAAILQEAETVLLRAPADQAGKKSQYARIADALGSNKALLRSA